MRSTQTRVALLACLPVAIALAGCGAPPAPAPAQQASAEDLIKRGEMLVIGGLCHDCHTPKVMTPRGPEADLTRALSGHPESQVITAPYKQDPNSPFTIHFNDDLTAASGPWGLSFAANLTPDENTGIGIWTEDMFIRALKEGKHMGTSRPILPPMPWNWVGQLPEEDLRAIFAYLKSLPPIRNRVPVPLGPDGKPIEDPQ